MEQRLDATYLRPGPIAWSAATGLAAAGIGFGILLAVWGISFLWRYTPPEIAVRIANPEVRVRQDVPFTVKQDKPFEITQPEVTIRVEQPLPSLGTGDKAIAGDVITREVIVFSEVKHGAGTVVTGWKYKNGSGGKPVGQFCYYTVPNGDLSSTRVDIASDGVRLPHINEALVPDLAGGLAKCQWWQV